MSVNKVILIGNVGKDVELRFMPNGEAVANFSLATTENWKDKSGEKQSKTEWHNCTAYKKLAEIIGKYVKKGSQLYIEGKLQTRKWQTKEGQDRYTTEIIVNEMTMLGGKSERTESTEKPVEKQVKGNEQDKPSNFDNFDDDIPF